MRNKSLYFLKLKKKLILCENERRFFDKNPLLARELKATCLLNLAYYSEAESEAEYILSWAPFSGKALFIYAESLYLQCKVSTLCEMDSVKNSKWV